jgi:20S proteasome alpha/beta subunit
VTLLVGILCPEGVIVATDRQVTHGAMGMPTIGQTGTKGVIIRKGEALYASSGPIGMGQQIANALDKATVNFALRTCVDCVGDLSKAARTVIIPAFEVAQRAMNVLGPQATHADAVGGGLLAARFHDGVTLVEFNPQGGCEILTLESVPFVCQGSGKANADPFLRFVWDIFWSKKPPTLNEAILAGYWTVRVVTQLRTSGVGCGVEVFTVRDVGGKSVAAKVEDSAVEEHDDFIAAVEDAMRSVRDNMSKTATAPSPPEGPKEKAS